jgi:NADH dehydrogenase (ubiquinone) 1 alpha/beta subcomplex 1
MNRLIRTAAAAAVRAQPSFTVRTFSAAQAFLGKDEVTSRVFDVVKANEKVDPAKVVEAAHFINDLGLDSLDTVEVVMAIEEEFAIEIPDAEAEKILTCDDAIAFLVAHPQAK